jgi:hypothetical protein
MSVRQKDLMAMFELCKDWGLDLDRQRQYDSTPVDLLQVESRGVIHRLLRH